MMTIRFRRACRRPLAIAVPLLLTLAVSAAAQPRLALQPHDRVMLVGNTLAERQQLFNHFETSLLTRFPELELTVRNLGLERRHAGAAAAAAQLRRRRDPPDGAARRRHPGLLRPQRIVRGRGRRRRLRARSRGLGRAPSRGALQRPVGAADRAGVADRARAGGRGWSTSTSRRATASWPATPRRCGALAARLDVPVRRRVHADAGGDGRLAGAADDQRHPSERDRRSGVRRDSDDGARLRTGPVRHLGDGDQGLRHAARAGARPRTSSGSIASGR